MKDEDDDESVACDFTGCVDFFVMFVLFVWDDGDERFDDDDLSLVDVDERMDEDLLTRDVIIGEALVDSNELFKDNELGGDGESLPILEHVWARRANGLWLASYFNKREKTFYYYF